MLLASIILMTLALLLYTSGVWGEKLSGGLKAWNLSLFWAGLAFDSTGTVLMSFLNESGTISLHTVTGAAAILLMIFHALWATLVLIKKKEKQKKTFHRFSIVVWLIWLVPYATGVVLGMK